MKPLKEYEEQLNNIIRELNQLEQRKNQLTTQGLKLQGIVEELNKPDKPGFKSPKIK